ncbi:hypothetical protein OG948_47910 (plasmid) [Embleya sp. NBC_00888]|uniref:hypothetical protein n=1 Tax=Embleya sp. NBC_00888 TaxID=2975960 RepID=UPI002F90E3AA|nr:hypothetical protein OG948_47910 [Embleya sp. NBC_00888]
MKTIRRLAAGSAMVVVVLEALWALGFVLFMGDVMVFGFGAEGDGPDSREVFVLRTLMWTVVAGACVQAAWVCRSLVRRLRVHGSARWGIGAAIVAHGAAIAVSALAGSGLVAPLLLPPLGVLLVAAAITRGGPDVSARFAVPA